MDATAWNCLVSKLSSCSRSSDLARLNAIFNGLLISLKYRVIFGSWIIQIGSITHIMHICSNEALKLFQTIRDLDLNSRVLKFSEWRSSSFHPRPLNGRSDDAGEIISYLVNLMIRKTILYERSNIANMTWIFLTNLKIIAIHHDN